MLALKTNAASSVGRARSFRASQAQTGTSPATGPVREGFAVGMGLRADRTTAALRWIAGIDGAVVRGRGAAQLTGELRLPRLAGGWLAMRLKGGLAIGADSVPQLSLRAGGLNTVRGYDFGITPGDALWAAQLDFSRPSRRPVKLIGFVDAGQAGFRSTLRTRAAALGRGNRCLGAGWVDPRRSQPSDHPHRRAWRSVRPGVWFDPMKHAHGHSRLRVTLLLAVGAAWVLAHGRAVGMAALTNAARLP